jgi:hypothetical protein
MPTNYIIQIVNPINPTGPKGEAIISHGLILNYYKFVYEARAERSAADDNLCPENWQNRYGGLIWRNIS